MRRDELLVIDGSIGEGGGQILRSAVALSALLLRPIRVENIRANRRKPGLQPQHIAAIKAVAAICRGETRGLNVGSSEIEFEPQQIEGGKFRVDVGTAGAVTLVLQAVLVGALESKKPIEIEIIGGTDVPWSPPIEYLDWITLSTLGRFGYKVSTRLIKRGYYPGGGGRVEVIISPARLSRIQLSRRGEIRRILGISYAEERLRGSRVAERQKEAASGRLKARFPHHQLAVNVQYASSYSPGSGIVLMADAEFSRLGSSALGERGKRAELVGAEAADFLTEEILSGAALDRHMADQIIPYLAVAGGEATVSQITRHTQTNLEVVRLFGLDIDLQGRLLTAKSIKVNTSK